MLLYLLCGHFGPQFFYCKSLIKGYFSFPFSYSFALYHYRLFGGMPEAKVDYNLVPTVVFSHPVIGTIGLTEQQAREKFPESELKIYTSDFVNLYYGTFFEGNAGAKPITKYKVICHGVEERVIGLHLIGKFVILFGVGFNFVVDMMSLWCACVIKHCDHTLLLMLLIYLMVHYHVQWYLV